MKSNIFGLFLYKQAKTTTIKDWDKMLQNLDKILEQFYSDEEKESEKNLIDSDWLYQ